MQNLVWIDLEMTGLNTKEHKIIEIATIITDSELNIVATGPNLVIHQDEAELSGLDPWVDKTHTESGLFTKVRNSHLTMQQAEQQSLDFISKYVSKDSSPLCGNSIGTDRAFLQEQMPELANYVNYRNLDVSSLKLLYKYWYPAEQEFKKSNNHRALDDIKESIAELKYYRKTLFKAK